MKPPGRDPASALALAVLSAATALAFDRVFADGSYLLPTLGAALLPHALGWFTRRWRWPAATTVVVSVVGLALYASWTAAGSTTFLGIPGPSTPGELLTVLGRGWGILRTGIAPVPAGTGPVLLTVVALWLMASVADALAFDADASIGAIVPSLAVFVVASSLGPRELSVWGTGAYLAAALAFLALCHRELLEQRRSWFTGRPGDAGVSLVGVGVGIGAVAILVGIVVAPALPGANSAPLLDYKRHSRGGGYQSRVNPLVDIKSRLTGQRDTQLFTVASPSRLYWRLVALDVFDGTEWTLSSSSRAASGVLTGPTGGAGTVRQTYRITGLDDRWLPAAYEPTGIDLEGALVVPESRTLLHADDSMVGLRYDVVSRVPPAEPDASQIAATAGARPSSLDRFLDLPAGFPAKVRDTARQITVSSRTPYEKAKALESFFTTTGGFTYDLNVPPGSGNDAITEFLQVKRGFCEQFAGTFAAMARAVGLPTRVAVGFTPGTYDVADGIFTVTGRNAHAWPEVWLGGLGWTKFEPTPVGDAPGAADPAGAGAAAGAAGPDATATTSTTTAAGPTTPTTAPVAGGAPGPRVAVPADRPNPGGGSDRSRWIVGGVLGILVAALTFRVGRSGVVRSRRRRARRAGPPRSAVVGAWAEALERLDDHGVSVAPAQTPSEVVGVAATSPDPVPATREPLARLADATALALWSPTEPAPADADRAWNDLADLEVTLRERTPRTVRVRRALRGVLSPADSRPTVSRRKPAERI